MVKNKKKIVLEDLMISQSKNESLEIQITDLTSKLENCKLMNKDKTTDLLYIEKQKEKFENEKNQELDKVETENKKFGKTLKIIPKNQDLDIKTFENSEDSTKKSLIPIIH